MKKAENEQPKDPLIDSLPGRVDNVPLGTFTESLGRVTEIADGLARISGLMLAKVGELLEFQGEHKGFVLNLDAHELQGPGGTLVDLTTMELQLLACLAQRPRQALSRNDISLEVSGRPRERRDRTIDVVVSKLRRKLEDASTSQVDPIQTVRGVGYKFVSEVRAA